MTEFSGYLIFSGVYLLLWSMIAGIPLMIAYERLRSYQAGQCRIVAKRLLETRSLVPSESGYGSMTTTTMYRPEFDFIIQTADGQEYQAQGYDALRAFTQLRSRNQAIVDLYTVGATYPCWYDPANPTQAILTQKRNWPFYVSGGVFVTGWICLILGILLQLS